MQSAETLTARDTDVLLHRIRLLVWGERGRSQDEPDNARCIKAQR